MGPLEGTLVIDLSRAMAGPYCTMMLADLGARVVKIERPRKGDDTRGWGPPFQGQQSVYFLSVNRNKESLVLDLKTARGLATLKALVARADVLVENFRPGYMAKRGLDYPDLAKLNPRLVYGRITGFGSSGPYKDRAGYDLIAQGMAGFMGVTGPVGGPPTKVGVPVGDINAGMFLAFGVAAALYRRTTTGKGQLVETSLYEGQMAQLTYQAGRYFADPEDVARPDGNRHPLIVPYATYEARDGWVNLAVGSEGLWERFCKAIGMPELVRDPRFGSNPERVAHRDELDRILVPVLKTRSKAELLELMEKAGIPCGPVASMDEILSDPHAAAREMVVELPHPDLGKVKVMGMPVKFSGTPGKLRSYPPRLGEHSVYLLEDLLGMTPFEARALAKEQAEGEAGD